MKRLLPALLLLAGFLAPAQDGGGRPARVLRDAVNIRARATLEAEVIGQLRRGDEVRARGEVAVTNMPPGEPALWYIIELPAAVKLWVNAGFLDADTGEVRVKRLNVRAGPGEEFSIVGRLAGGAVVSEVAREGDWMQIQPPPGVFGFVAGEYLKIEAPPDEPPPAATAAPPRETPPPASPAGTPGETPAQPAPQEVPRQEISTPAPPPEAAATIVVAAPAAEAAPPAETPTGADAPGPAPLSSGSSLRPVLDAAGEPRVVRREGRLARAWNIQAPGFYAIRDLETGRVMNYLHGDRFADRRWSEVRGRTVVITGREFLDARWPDLPVLEAERVEIVR